MPGWNCPEASRPRAAASKASPVKSSSASPCPPASGLGARRAPGQAQQRMRGCRAEGAGGSVLELGKVPPRLRCCCGGRALVTAAQPCQQQPEEEKPQTQELFWGRKRALTLPRCSAQHPPAVLSGAQMAPERPASLAVGCREREAGAGARCPSFIPARELGDGGTVGTPALVRAPHQHEAPAQGARGLRSSCCWQPSLRPCMPAAAGGHKGHRQDLSIRPRLRGRWGLWQLGAGAAAWPPLPPCPTQSEAP